MNYNKTGGCMTRKDIAGLFKRFLITFGCSLPVLLSIGFLLKGKVSDFVMIVLYVTIAGTILAIEELIHYKRKQKRELLKEQISSENDYRRKETTPKSTQNNSKKEKNKKQITKTVVEEKNSENDNTKENE